MTADAIGRFTARVVAFGIIMIVLGAVGGVIGFGVYCMVLLAYGEDGALVMTSFAIGVLIAMDIGEYLISRTRKKP